MAIGTAERNENIKKLREMIKDINIAMLTTIDDNGQTLRSRPMATQQVEFDGDLWFFTGLDSPKVDEVQEKRFVNVSYVHKNHERFVSMSGWGTIVTDMGKKEELWNPAFKIWFPNGLDDPNLALLKIEVEQGEYWEGSNNVQLMVSAVKTLLTGQPGDIGGENKKIELK
jgi:general stress protein 26